MSQQGLRSEQVSIFADDPFFIFLLYIMEILFVEQDLIILFQIEILVEILLKSSRDNPVYGSTCKAAKKILDVSFGFFLKTPQPKHYLNLNPFRKYVTVCTPSYK